MGKPTKHTHGMNLIVEAMLDPYIDAPHGHITVQLGVGTFKEFHKSL